MDGLPLVVLSAAVAAKNRRFVKKNLTSSHTFTFTFTFDVV